MELHYSLLHAVLSVQLARIVIYVYFCGASMFSATEKVFKLKTSNCFWRENISFKIYIYMILRAMLMRDILSSIYMSVGFVKVEFTLILANPPNLSPL